MRKGKAFHSSVDVNLNRDEKKIRDYMMEVKGSLQELYPNIAKEWHPTKNEGLKPDSFKPGSDYKAWWKCSSCGEEWKTSISHRVYGTGCPACYRDSKKRNSSTVKKVCQYTKDGDLIREWYSISEAGRELNISPSNISMCTKGKRPNAGGYLWKLKEK